MKFKDAVFPILPFVHVIQHTFNGTGWYKHEYFGRGEENEENLFVLSQDGFASNEADIRIPIDQEVELSIDRELLVCRTDTGRPITLKFIHQVTIKLEVP